MIQVDWKIKKVWMKDEQREWFEYEMTLMFNIDREWHLAIASKDRTNLFLDRDPFLISKEIWEEIKKWNLSWEKVKTLEEKQSENFSKYFDIFTNIKEKEEFEKEVRLFKWNIASDGSFISKKQFDELSEIIQNIKKSYESLESNEEKDE